MANPSGGGGGAYAMSAYAMRPEGAEDEQRRLLLEAEAEVVEKRRLLLAERARADSQQREIDELRSRDAAALGLRAEVRGARVTAAADSAMRGSAERRAAAAEEEAAAARHDAKEARREVEEHALLLRQLRSSARAMATVAERAKRAEREARAADGLEAEAEVVEKWAEAATAGQPRDPVKPMLAPQPLDEAAMLEATLFSPAGGGGGSTGLVERDLASLRADMRGFQALHARSVGGAPPPPLLLAAMDAVASAGEDAFAKLLQRELRTPAEMALLAGLLGVRPPPRSPQPRASSLQPHASSLQHCASSLQPYASSLQPLCLQELSQLSAARVAGVGSLSRLQGAVRLCAEEMALEAQQGKGPISPQGRRAGKTAAAKTAAAKAAGAVAAVAEGEEAAGAWAKPEAAAGPHVRWSGSHPWRDSAAAQAESWREAHAARDEAQRVRAAARLAPPASDTSAVSGERAGGHRAAGGRAAPRPGRSEPSAPDGVHTAHDPAHLQPERTGPPPPPAGLPQLVGRHNPANPTAPALKLDHVSLKPRPRYAVPADLDMPHPGAVHLPTAPGSMARAGSKPGSPARAAHPPATRAALSPRAARDTRLPAASLGMSSQREREAGLGDVARHSLESRGLELEVAAWGGSGFGSPLPIAGGASERWLPSGSGARMASGSGPPPSHTRTELDAWRRKGPGGVGAGPVGVGVSPLSPRTPRRL